MLSLPSKEKRASNLGTQKRAGCGYHKIAFLFLSASTDASIGKRKEGAHTREYTYMLIDGWIY